jgi:heparanase 1
VKRIEVELEWNSVLRVLVAFGLNALFNRSRLWSGEWSPWDSSNARGFIKFTVEHGIAVEAWELGNQKP